MAKPVITDKPIIDQAEFNGLKDAGKKFIRTESGVLTSEDVWAKVKQIVEITSKNRIP